MQRVINIDVGPKPSLCERNADRLKCWPNHGVPNLHESFVECLLPSFLALDLALFLTALRSHVIEVPLKSAFSFLRHCPNPLSILSSSLDPSPAPARSYHSRLTRARRTQPPLTPAQPRRTIAAAALQDGAQSSLATATLMPRSKGTGCHCMGQ